MTTQQILTNLNRHGKTVCLQQLYRYLKAAGIQPVGARQRPQVYPQDTVTIICRHLGIDVTTPPRQRTTAPKSHIISMKQIKAGRAQ